MWVWVWGVGEGESLTQVHLLDDRLQVETMFRKMDAGKAFFLFLLSVPVSTPYCPPPTLSAPVRLGSPKALAPCFIFLSFAALVTDVFGCLTDSSGLVSEDEFIHAVLEMDRAGDALE